MVVTIEEEDPNDSALNNTNSPDFRENAQTVILSPMQADSLKKDLDSSSRKRHGGSDYAPRRSNTPDNKGRGAINLANVDKYVGEISKLQMGKSTRGTHRR